MSWAKIIWSMSAAVSLTLGAIHFVVWFQDRTAALNLIALATEEIAICSSYE